MHSISRENSEQHELAWCLGCVRGIRPCSLAGPDGLKDEVLRWRDINISRGEAPDGMHIPDCFVTIS